MAPPPLIIPGKYCDEIIYGKLLGMFQDARISIKVPAPFVGPLANLTSPDSTNEAIYDKETAAAT